MCLSLSLSSALSDGISSKKQLIPTGNHKIVENKWTLIVHRKFVNSTCRNCGMFLSVLVFNCDRWYRFMWLLSKSFYRAVNCSQEHFYIIRFAKGSSFVCTLAKSVKDKRLGAYRARSYQRKHSNSQRIIATTSPLLASHCFQPCLLA